MGKLVRNRVGGVPRILAALGIVLLVALLLLPACGVLQSLANIGNGGKCDLDVTSVKSIREFDFQGELEIPEDASKKVEDVLVAIAELKAFADQVDHDLGTACADIAKDLGALPVKGAAPTIEASCQDAGLRLKDALLSIVTEKTTIKLEVTPPSCSIDLHATASCAADCDEDFDPKMPILCDKGKSVGDAGCAGDMKFPDLSSECEAKCSVEANASASCTPPKVSLEIEGGADPHKIEHLKEVIVRGATRVFHVSMALGHRAIKLAGTVKGIAMEIKGAVEALVKKMSNPKEAARRGAKLASCLTPAFQGVIDMATKIKNDIMSATALKDKLEAAVKEAAEEAKQKAMDAVKDAEKKAEGAVKDAEAAAQNAAQNAVKDAQNAAQNAVKDARNAAEALRDAGPPALPAPPAPPTP